MELHMAKLCENVELNERGRPVLSGLFMYIVVPVLPFNHPPVYCALEVDLEREVGMREAALCVRLKNPQGDVIQNVSTPAQRHGAGPFGSSVRIFAACYMPGFRLEEPGRYSVEVLCDEVVVGSDMLAVMTTDEAGRVLG